MNETTNKIAAVHDLLEVCSSMADWIEATLGTQSSLLNKAELRAQVSLARAVIAKAEGARR